MFDVITDVPPPAALKRVHYQWQRMGIGDSIIVPAKYAPSAQSSASQHGKRTGKRFASRKLPDGGRQVWRVA